MSDSHAGIVAFKPLAMGRESVMLGRVQVAEIMPIAGDRFGASFRLLLPDASATTWRPARDMEKARELVLAKINDWLNAADLRPAGAA